MRIRYATFADNPRGASLALSGASRAVTTTADALNRSRAAIGSIVAPAGSVAGVEAVFSGDGPLAATFGVIPTTAVNTEPGTGSGYGWRLDSGELLHDGQTVATGIPVPDQGQAVGLSLDLDSQTLRLYIAHDLVHTQTLTAAQAAKGWRFAVALGSTLAGDLTCTINTGQSGAATAALLDGGWHDAPPQPTTLRVASDDWLTGPGDTPANARYEGVLDPQGIELVAAVAFWPWRQSGAATAAGDIPLLDGAGRMDAVGDDADSRVVVRRLPYGEALAQATPLGSFTLTRTRVTGDMQRSLQLGDSLSALDDPLPRELYLPEAGSALAWRPQPIVIGACRNAPLASVNSDGSLQWIADAPCMIRAVRERGRDLTRDTDFAPDRSRQALQLVSPPISGLYADISSAGTPGADIWGGGAAHAGTLGGSTSTLASGAAARYALTASVPDGGRLIVSLSDDASGAVAAFEASGDYEGVIVNPLTTAATLYLIGEGGATVSGVTLQPLDDNATGPASAPLALALREVFRRARFGAWSLTDAQAIDTATGYAGIGLYAGEQAVTARQLYRWALASYCAADWQDADGTLRLARLVDPAAQTPTFAISELDMAAELHKQPDMAPGLTTRMTWRPNVRALGEGDLSTDTVAVPAWRRRQLTAAAQGTVWSGVTLAPRYASFAAQAPAMPSRFDIEADAQAEIDRVCGLYAVERHFYTVPLVDLEHAYHPGQPGTLTYARHGLAAHPVIITRVRHNPVTGATELTCWG